MKKLCIILTFAAMLCSCGGNKSGVDDTLQGTYSIDVSDAGSLFEKEFQIPAGMISSVLSAADLTVEFKDSKAIIDHFLNIILTYYDFLYLFFSFSTSFPT